MDAKEWISDLVRLRCDNATICLDAFHLVKWVTDARDELAATPGPRPAVPACAPTPGISRGARYALWKNPEDLTAHQETMRASVAKVNGRLYRGLTCSRAVPSEHRHQGTPGAEDAQGLAGLGGPVPDPHVRRARPTIRKNLPGIGAALLHDLSNALIESTNTRLGLLTRVA